MIYNVSGLEVSNEGINLAPSRARPTPKERKGTFIGASPIVEKYAGQDLVSVHMWYILRLELMSHYFDRLVILLTEH
jgi:hypothetical protein